MTPAAILLAAGASARLGRPKQLLELDGEALVRRAARLGLEAGFAPMVVVVGSSAEAVQSALEGLPVQCVVNAEWQEGMAASIRAGLGAVPAGSSGVLLLACDQPALARGILEAFRAIHQRWPARTLAAAYGGGLGIPALFPRSRFAGLLGLRGDRGAKALLGEAETIPFPGGEFDFDTPEDLLGWIRR